jgi:hypothetical protein
MIRTEIAPNVALFLLAVLSLPGTAAFAGCDSKGSAWEEPNADYYCANPNAPPPKFDNSPVPPFLRTFPLFRRKKPRTPYFVQMYSGQERSETLQIKTQMTQRFRSTLGCCELDLGRIDLGMLGPYWSVWAGPVKSKALAVELCQTLRLEGLQACVVEPQ